MKQIHTLKGGGQENDRNSGDTTDEDDANEEEESTEKEKEDTVKEGDSDEEDTKDDDIVIDYDYNEEEEKYNGKKPAFANAVVALKTMFEKSANENVKIINEHKVDVKYFRKVKHGVEADIEVSKMNSKTKGFALVKIWGPSKGKNKCTIMVSNIKKHDAKSAKTLSTRVIKPLLDNYLTGKGWKSLVQNFSDGEDKVKCTVCDKPYSKAYLKIHTKKATCTECKICFRTKNGLEGHNRKVHENSAINLIKTIISEGKKKNDKIEDGHKTHPEDEKANMVRRQTLDEESFRCNACYVVFSSEKELLLHNDKTHIHDDWRIVAVSSKRNIDLVKSSSVTEPSKKKVTSLSEKEENEYFEDNHKIEIEADPQKKAETDSNLEDAQKMEEEIETITESNDKKIETEKNNVSLKDLPPGFKELPNSVKNLHPESVEFVVPGNGACCMNCLGAWIMLQVSEGTQLSRDMNTHLAEYRDEYVNKMPFPRTICLGPTGEKKMYRKGEQNKFFDTLVESHEASFMWRESVDVNAMANFANMEIEIDIYNPKTGLVEATQSYKPDEDFPWNENEANKPIDHKYEKMKMINYKNTHFNLIVDTNSAQGKALIDSRRVKVPHRPKETSRCEECHEIISGDSKMKDHMEIHKAKKREVTQKTLQCWLKELEITIKELLKIKMDNEKVIENLSSELVIVKSENKEIKKINKLTHDNNPQEPCQQVHQQSGQQVHQVLQVPGQQVQQVHQQPGQKYHKLPEFQPTPKPIPPPATKPTPKPTPKSSAKHSPNDDSYDETDEEELDSERVLLKGKLSGYRRNTPQGQPNVSNTLSCPKCYFKVTNISSLEDHMKQHEKLQMKCGKCSSIFNDEKSLKFHIDYEHLDCKDCDCDECVIKRPQKTISTDHIVNSHIRNINRKELHCKMCDFKTSSKQNLKDHFTENHREEIREEFNCQHCEDTFTSKWYLNSHRRDEHMRTEVCSFFRNNKCKFPADKCWNSHEITPGENDKFGCYVCNQTFLSKNRMMRHRKREHPESAQMCREFGIGSCDKEEDNCWYLHKKDFQIVRNKNAPPLGQVKSVEKISGKQKGSRASQ